MRFIKPWKVRDISDKEYARLGDTPDARKARADLIEAEITNNWKWLFEKPKDILMAVLGFTMIIGVSTAIMYLSGGTPAESCSGMYIKGEIDLGTLKEQCPSLSKQSLLSEIEKSNQNNKSALKFDVESNF